jgi:hypothetical protein
MQLKLASSRSPITRPKILYNPSNPQICWGLLAGLLLPLHWTRCTRTGFNRTGLPSRSQFVMFDDIRATTYTRWSTSQPMAASTGSARLGWHLC